MLTDGASPRVLKLIIMRHAKSSWTDKKLDDFDRPLSRRGKEAAPVMGRALADKNCIPELILCSPARRTRETLKLFADAMGVRPPVAYEDQLYSFGNGDSYLNAIAAQKTVSPLMVIGHNPSVQNLSLRLIESQDGPIANRIRRKFPTAAAAIIAFPIEDWRQIQSKRDVRGEIELFLTPKMLRD
jgi:phosphohistidine phosphatase